MHKITITGVLLAVFLLAALPARAAQAKTVYQADIWTNVAPPSMIGGSSWVKVTVTVHTDPRTDCYAYAIGSPPKRARSGFSPGIANTDDRGVAIFGTVHRANDIGTHRVEVTCLYNAGGSGPSPSQTYHTSFSIPAKSVTVDTSPPPALQIWVDPTPASRGSTLTLNAKTVPGALCSATFYENGAIPSAAGRAGPKGIVFWTWTASRSGTVAVTCDAHKRLYSGSASYDVG